MKSPRSKTARPTTPFPAGAGIGSMEMALRTVVRDRSWDAHKPLPTTRELGDLYGVSNSSACRLLKRLEEDGVLWRQENGRYFPPESRAIFERQKPFACLLRKLQNWSQIYHDVMGGVTEAFGRRKAAMLFVHNDVLVRHSDTAHPPVHADAAAQRAALEEFLKDHDREFGGVLVDEVWLDDVLADYASELTNAVVVCRPTTVAGVSSVSVDFAASAIIAVGHLYARGFEDIWLAVPFRNVVAVDSMLEQVRNAAERLGRPIAAAAIRPVSTPEEREQFVAALKGSTKRIGVFCPEDNVSLLLHRALAVARIPCPAQVGLLSGMGTRIVSDQHISSLRIDYLRIGRTAGEILQSAGQRNVVYPADLTLGQTT